MVEPTEATPFHLKVMVTFDRYNIKVQVASISSFTIRNGSPCPALRSVCNNIPTYGSFEILVQNTLITQTKQIFTIYFSDVEIFSWLPS